MTKLRVLIYIALSFGIFIGVCHASGDEVRIHVMTDKMVYPALGDTLTLSVSVANLAGPVTADVHIGVIPPGGEPIYEWPDWNTSLTPCIENYTVPSGGLPLLDLFSIPIAADTIPFTEPGIYMVFIALTQPGTLNFIGDFGFTHVEVVSLEGLRTTETFTVMPAVSTYNLFEGTVLPQNPGMAENNFNGGHQDSYCSDSVGLSGPTGKKLEMVSQFNPYGFTPIMACNKKNQMTGVSLSYADHAYRLIVFDKDLHILSATKTSDFVAGSFGGGYFFMDRDDNSVVVGDNRMKCFPTADVEKKDSVYELEPIWVSDDIVRLVTQSDAPNSLYATLPVWNSAKPNVYWCLLAGHYNIGDKTFTSPAYMAVVQIVPDAAKLKGCRTVLLDKLVLPRQWNNNTFSVDEQGAYFVTNGLDEHGVCNQGYLYGVAFDDQTGQIAVRWSYPYRNSGLLKPGSKNIGSGTTPTIMQDAYGNKLIAIVDNDYPQINVVAVSHSGAPVAEVPVFADMRGTAEASVIGVNRSIVVENNFGHTTDVPWSQWVPNEPGLALIELGATSAYPWADQVWENDHTSFFAMSMLARESGIIFAHTGDWDDAISATEGGMYFVSAIDSWDGRTIWKIPLGRGWKYCHEFGGIYFNHNGSLYMGTNSYLILIRNDPQSN